MAALEKVSIVSSGDPLKKGSVGGKATHLQLLMKGLSASGVSTELISARKTSLFRLRRTLSGALVRKRMEDREQRFEHFMAQYSAQLRRCLAEAALDSRVVNAHDVSAARDVWFELGRRGKEPPVVLTLHGYFTREASSNHELKEGSQAFERGMRLEKSMYERASRIICVDSRIREYVIDMADIEPDRVVTTPNGVDTDAFRPTSKGERESARCSLGFGPSETVVLCPRRLVVKNGVEFAVKAMASLSKDRKDVRLVVTGDGTERGRLEKLVRESGLQGSVTIAGTVPHERMPAYYAASDVVIVPSISSVGVEEATSLSMLEGMASGVPVVVSDIGGLKETVRNEHNGLMVPQANPGALADAIIRLSEDRALYESIARNALGYVRENHSYLEHAKKILAEYEKALARPVETRDG